MLDTLKLSINEYSIAPDNRLTVQPASYLAGSGEVVSEFPLFRDESGRSFRGAKAYLNTDRFNLTLQPFSRGGEVGASCFVQFSVPKIHSGNNYYSVGEAGSKAVVELVERELRENGVSTSLQEANISRLDTFKNIQPEEPFSSYYSLFPLLKARRTIQRGYGTTFLVHNTQQEWCVYDKIEEMRQRGVDLSEFPARTMRFEHRLLNGAKVEAVHGFKSVGALFSGGYEVVREKARESWSKSLFSFQVEDVIRLGAQELEQELKHFKEKFGRNYFPRFLSAYGAYHLAQYAGVEVVRLALQGVEAERTKIWRAEKLLQETKREIDMLKKAEGSDKTLSTLYQELRAKVCLN